MEFFSFCSYKVVENLTYMTREEMIDKIIAINNPQKEKNVIYAIADELGLKLKRTRCVKCLRDYIAILKEELGVIESAGDESDFNSESEHEYIYTPSRPCIWNGYIINQDTPVEVIREFVKKFPNGYYKINNKTE